MDVDKRSKNTTHYVKVNFPTNHFFYHSLLSSLTIIQLFLKYFTQVLKVKNSVHILSELQDVQLWPDLEDVVYFTYIFYKKSSVHI